MGIFDFLKKSNDSPGKTKVKKPKFMGTETSGNGTYEVYKSNDVESAKAFLMEKRVDKPQYYVVVETPGGNWGMDIKGLYLERLLPWQKNIQSAECSGTVTKMPDMFGLQMAARGINDNFVTEIKCGKCETEWHDAIRYKNVTVVKCPGCKALNKVDSNNYNVVMV